MNRLEAILDRLISVKLWSAVAGVVLVIIYGDNLDPEVQAGVLVAIPTVLIFVQGVIDAIFGQRDVK